MNNSSSSTIPQENATTAIRVFGGISYALLSTTSILMNTLLISVLFYGHYQFRRLAFFTLAWQMVFCDLMTQSVQLIIAVPVTLMGQPVYGHPTWYYVILFVDTFAYNATLNFSALMTLNRLCVFFAPRLNTILFSPKNITLTISFHLSTYLPVLMLIAYLATFVYIRFFFGRQNRVRATTIQSSIRSLARDKEEERIQKARRQREKNFLVQSFLICGQIQVCIRGWCCSQTVTPKSQVNVYLPKDQSCPKGTFNVELLCHSNEDCIRTGGVTIIPFPILECGNQGFCCTSSKYRKPLQYGDICLNGGNALGQRCQKAEECQGRQQQNIRTGGSLLCVDDECCTQPTPNQKNVPNFDERQGVANKCPSGIFTGKYCSGSIGNECGNPSTTFCYQGICCSTAASRQDSGLDDFSRGSSACSTYNYKYINRHCATPLNCGLQTDNYICISGYCCVKSNAICYDGTPSNQQCFLPNDCGDAQKTCVNNICCPKNNDYDQYACGGLQSIGHCDTKGQCSVGECVSAQVCCECPFGQPQKQTYNCKEGSCEKGYFCSRSGFCCPQCQNGKIPRGSCHLGQCGAGSIWFVCY
uniref:7TM GPCR serpentine receptor class x (Srx) domain-containing protein n=1 Tax=Meloidogyne javanica TaxID=6303 RepID=A0A915LV60_MELJA